LGGFDIAIGNPPYVEVSEQDYKYSIFQTLNTRNLYSYMMENNIKNNSESGFFGFIVPLSSMYTPRMRELQNFLLIEKELYISNFAKRPGKIFKNVEQRVSIITGCSLKNNEKSQIYTTKYLRWFAKERKTLFQNIKFVHNPYKDLNLTFVPKVGNEIESNILSKLFNKHQYQPKPKLRELLVTNKGENKIIYHSSAQYWLKAFNFIPMFYNKKRGVSQSSEYKTIYSKEGINPSVIACLINSSLFYWYWILLSDERHFLKKDIEEFPINYKEIETDSINLLVKLLGDLMESYKTFSEEKTVDLGGNAGIVKYQEFHPKHSKKIIDEIDNVFGELYGFTSEELDFIKNYDIRFRMS
jgi:hypothetical protein